MDDFHGLPDYESLDRDSEMRVPNVGAPGINRDSPKKRQHREEQEKKPPPEAQDRFDELAAAAETSNKILIENKSPYRFCVYRQEEEIFIDIVVLDEQGKIKSVQKKNITHDEFSKWIKHIEEREGLFFDEIG